MATCKTHVTSPYKVCSAAIATATTIAAAIITVLVNFNWRCTLCQKRNVSGRIFKETDSNQHITASLHTS